MQPNQSPQVDNYISKFSRIYRYKNSFKSDDGKTIDYERLVLEYFVKGEALTIEIPIRKDSPVTPKDVLLLNLADKLDQPAFNAPQE